MADLTSKNTLLKWYDKNFCLQAVAFDWRLFVFVKVHTEDLHLQAMERILKSRLRKLRATRVRKLSGAARVKTSMDEFFLEALKLVPEHLSDHQGDDLPLLTMMREPTRKVILEVLKEFPLNLRYIENPDQAMILTAVTHDAYSLAYIDDQNDEICKAAVSNNPYVLQYVKNQTEEICKLAISQDSRAFAYVKKPTVEIIKFAVRLDINALCFIDIKKFPEIIEYCKLLKY